MLSSQLMAMVAPLLRSPPAGMDWRDMLSVAISAGLSNGSFVKVQHGLQPIGALVMERQVVHAITARLALGDTARLMARSDVDVVVDDVFALDGVDLNAEQRSAIHAAASHAFVCITGGAGVGKTTVLKALYHLYERMGVHVIQVALAGRAAKRMQEATGRAASTIASFLKASAEATFDGPTVLVIDEASMVDIISMSRICQALPVHVRLVLVGDPHQLMPVGPGLVLHAIQKVSGVPAVELKTVKRYGGDIAVMATAIRAGRWPALSFDETAPAAFLECEDALIAEMVVELYALDTANSQVLSPLRNGLSGTKRLNDLCQQRFTKERLPVKCWNEEFECEEHCGLHEGDVVLCTRNLWAKGLQNGSLGRVVQVEDSPTPFFDDSGKEGGFALAWIDWDDGVRKPLTRDMLDDLELGYAVTVHKAQGSQWPRVIVAVSESRMLDRTLLYTALTRAQKQVIFVGNLQAARRASIAPPRAAERSVALDLTLRTALSIAAP